MVTVVTKIILDTESLTVYKVCMADTKTIQIRNFPEDLLRQIKVEMAKRDMTLSGFVSLAVWAFLRKNVKK